MIVLHTVRDYAGITLEPFQMIQGETKSVIVYCRDKDQVVWNWGPYVSEITFKLIGTNFSKTMSSGQISAYYPSGYFTVHLAKAETVLLDPGVYKAVVEFTNDVPGNNSCEITVLSPFITILAPT